jgi:RHS repeat-associated protein
VTPDGYKYAKYLSLVELIPSALLREGARRNPNNWTQADTRTSLITHRGYTGHEHIDLFGIINMNGRVYDPMTAVFFSPDKYVQDPSDWMNYNRYSYCLNNPFRYTDPSGNFFIVDDVVVDAMIIAAIISAVAYTASVALSPGGFTNWNFCRLGIATAEGAIAGAATAGIGDLFGAVGGAGGELANAGINLGSVGNELARAAVHGLSNGLLNSAFGGDFAQGFASGALGSLGGSAFQAFGGEAAKSFIGTVAFSSVSGGLGSVLSGGDFWKGAAIGAIVGALNHWPHAMEKNNTWDKNGDGILQKSEADDWYMNGNGTRINVDGNKIDLSGLDASDMSYDSRKKIYSVDTIKAFEELPYETASTYGGSNFKLVDGEFQMQSQEYHYRMRPWNSISNVGRNILTIIGDPSMTIRPSQINVMGGDVTARGKAYMINIKY